jgi:hypothetical protein
MGLAMISTAFSSAFLLPFNTTLLGAFTILYKLSNDFPIHIKEVQKVIPQIITSTKMVSPYHLLSFYPFSCFIFLHSSYHNLEL